MAVKTVSVDAMQLDGFKISDNIHNLTPIAFVEE
jgi:hypothetical protein